VELPSPTNQTVELEDIVPLDSNEQLNTSVIITDEELNTTLGSDLLLEYRALGKLIILVPVYIISTNLVCFLALGINASVSEKTRSVIEKYNISPWWFASFHTVTGFGNAGMSLLSDNLMQFSNDAGVLVPIAFLIIFGNTFFPIGFRWLISALWKITKNPVYDYLLKNPRRCFTHLFPRVETNLLFFILVGVLVTEFVSFIWLDWNFVTGDTEQKILIGYFTSVSTRAAGFNCIDISQLSSAMLVLFVALMYLSAYPVSISVKQSNVFLEKTEATVDTYASQAKSFLFRDMSWMYILFFFICAVEAPHLRSEAGLDKFFTEFRVLFEVVSAYGNVGLSMGYPTINFSFCGTWHTASKGTFFFLFFSFFLAMLVVVMLLGRHRGIPDSVDPSVQLNQQSIEDRLTEEQANVLTSESFAGDIFNDLKTIQQNINSRAKTLINSAKLQ
jgi:Trk-type K+ transport system membrane component